MILLVQKYTPADPVRAAEFDRCLSENRQSGIFSDIVEVDGSEKRWTFADFFSLAAERFKGQHCVIANSDISFRCPSCEVLDRVISNGAMVALTRWNAETAPWMIGHYHDYRWFSGTQDVWGFVGGDFVGLGDILLGEPGCDCRLTAEVLKSGAVIWNPALSIRTLHVHESPNEIARPSPYGDYGYIEMTTVAGVGGVLIKKYPESVVYNFTRGDS